MILKPDFTSKSHAQDPQLLFEQIQAQGEVVKVKIPIMGGVWMTTSYEATAAMLKDNLCFTMRDPTKAGQVAGMQWWMPRSIRMLANNMLSTDEPDHRRLRKLVDQAFQRRSITKMDERIREIANDLLDQADSVEGFELVDSYARKLPLLVICELLGLEKRELDEFAQHAAKLTTINGIWKFITAMGRVAKMCKQLEHIVTDELERQAAGEFRPGLITELVRAEADGAGLSRDELVAMIFLLLIAGHETTTHMISGSVLTLLNEPGQLRELLDDPAHVKMDMAVEELLRHVSAVQFSKPRIVGKTG